MKHIIDFLQQEVCFISDSEMEHKIDLPNSLSNEILQIRFKKKNNTYTLSGLLGLEVSWWE